MPKKFLLVVLFLVSHLSFAQEAKAKYSFDFRDATLISIIQTIERATPYKFYFEEAWLVSDKTLTKTYTNAEIEAILTDVFETTVLNFYIDKNSIILTKNSLIYDTLPDNYFGESPSQSELNTQKEKPIFYKAFDSINPIQQQIEKTLVVGKESKISNQKSIVLSGYIKNAKTGEALSNVNVSSKNKKNTTLTDGEGFYQLELPPGINYIEASLFNYNKSLKKVILYSSGNLNIKLEEQINLLNEVVVNGKKSENVKSGITGVTTINIEGIKNIPLVLGERDIFKVATILPGIKQTGEGSAGFNVRGGKDDQNLILLDHGLIYNPSHFFGFFSSVNPFTTKKATIYKGSIPPEFGGRLSSVFDITSRTGNPTQFSGEGGIGPVTSNLTLSTPLLKDKSSLLVGARATYSGWILRSLKNKSLKNSNANFYDAILRYNYKINEKNNFEATLYYSKDAFNISSDSLYKYSNQLVSLKWEHHLTKKTKTALIFTNSEYKFNIDYDSANLNAFDFGYKISETQALLKFSTNWNEKHKLNYGLSSKLYGVNPGYLAPKNNLSTLKPITIDSEKGLESGIYLADNYKITEKLQIDFGLRYSIFNALGAASQKIYQENVPLNEATVIETRTFGNNQNMKTYGGLEPRISGRYFLADNFSIKASYDKTYQYIHLLSSNTTQSPTDTWKLSDINVKPQVAQQFSLGLYKNIPDKDVEISIEGYYKKSKNFLDYKVAAQLLLNQDIETQLLQGIGKAYGLEFLIKKNSGRLNGWIGYTYSRTFIKLDSPFSDERVNNGEYFPANFDKPHDISIVLNYRLTKRYSFSSNFIYQTGRPITYPIGKYRYGNAEYTLYSDRNQYRIPDYFRLDIGFNVEGNHKTKKLAHGFWNVSVYNALGRNNPYSIYFVAENGQIKAYKTSIFAIPIPTITYNFKF